MCVCVCVRVFHFFCRFFNNFLRNLLRFSREQIMQRVKNKSNKSRRELLVKWWSDSSHDAEDSFDDTISLITVCSCFFRVYVFLFAYFDELCRLLWIIKLFLMLYMSCIYIYIYIYIYLYIVMHSNTRGKLKSYKLKWAKKYLIQMYLVYLLLRIIFWETKTVEKTIKVNKVVMYTVQESHFKLRSSWFRRPLTFTHDAFRHTIWSL